MRHLFSISVVTIFSVLSATHAAEIAAFRTTGFSSQVQLDYDFDERISSNAGAEVSRTQQTVYEEKIFVNTQNYVYHPTLLKLNLGAGFTFSQEQYAGSNDDNGHAYDLSVSGWLLEKKPYPMSFYYIRSNPRITASQGGVVQQTFTDYGFNLTLKESPLPLQMDFYVAHDRNNASSPFGVTNESTDSYGFRAAKTYSPNYKQRLNYSHSEEKSSSGSLSLPITPTSLDTNLLTYSSNWNPAGQKQISYFDHLRITEASGVSPREEVEFRPTLRWKHSDKIESEYSYDYFDSLRNNVYTTTKQSANAILRYEYKDYTRFDAGIITAENAADGFNEQSIGVNGNIYYQRPIKIGVLALNTGFEYSQNDRLATASQVNVIGELVTLSGLTRSALAREYVAPGSILVQNSARTQTYIENVDYRVIVIGSRTEIQRLSGSNIADPEQVVVDYAYQIGGNAEFTDLTQNYHAGLLTDRYNLDLDYQLIDRNLVSGDPTLLNSSNRLSVKADTNYLLSKRIEVGADVKLERYDSDISSYDREEYGASSRFILPDSSDLYLAARRLIVDNLNSVEDNNLTNLTMILRSRPRKQMILSAEAFIEKDTGSTITLKKDYLKFNMQWRIYRLTMIAEAFFGSEQTGSTETEENRVMVTLKRDI